MGKKKVLVFIDWFLPGYRAGGPITSMKQMIENLHKELDFFVICRNTDYQSEVEYDFPCEKWVDQGTYQSYFVKESNLGKDVINKVVASQNFDIFYINGMYSKFFSILPLQILKNDHRSKIVAPRGMLAPSAMAIKPIKKKAFLALSKIKGWHKSVLFHATNLQEKEYITSVFKNAQVHVASNLGPSQSDRKPLDKMAGELKLIFLGRIAPEKNTLLAIQALKGLSGKKVILDIVGETYDQAYFQLCKNEANQFSDHIQVNFVGSMSPNLIPGKLQSYHYMFLPSKGENFGHSILESLMCGVPVIISDQTPWTHCEREGVGFVNINEQEQIQMSLKRLMAQNHQDYDKVCMKVKEFAQKYVKKSEAIDQTKALFELN